MRFRGPQALADRIGNLQTLCQRMIQNWFRERGGRLPHRVIQILTAILGYKWASLQSFGRFPEVYADEHALRLLTGPYSSRKRRNYLVLQLATKYSG